MCQTLIHLVHIVIVIFNLFQPLTTPCIFQFSLPFLLVEYPVASIISTKSVRIHIRIPSFHHSIIRSSFHPILISYYINPINPTQSNHPIPIHMCSSLCITLFNRIFGPESTARALPVEPPHHVTRSSLEL